MSTGGGYWRALERGFGIHCEVVQMFVKNNMQWFGRFCEAEDLARYTQQRETCKFFSVFGHTGYLINLGAAPSPNRDKSIQSLIQEITFATHLGLPFLVMHPGAHLGTGDDCGLNQIVQGLNEVFAATSKSTVRIALENTAGQGSCLGHKIAHLAAVYDRVKQPGRLGLCLDTAHLFEAGYDIRTEPGWNAVMDEVENLVGLEEILAFHLNDSRTDLGSRVDRHAGIGQGKIGKEPFRHIINDVRFQNHPGCLETPKSPDLHEDVENLAILRGLRRSDAVSKVSRRGRASRKKSSNPKDS